MEEKTTEEINSELAELFESDVKEFSEKGAKAFGHILKKRGIDNPQKWFEDRLRGDVAVDVLPYSYKDDGFGARFDMDTGAIIFKSICSIHKKFNRAHEMVHKITLLLMDKVLEGKIYSANRVGLLVRDIEMSMDEKTGAIKESYRVGAENGRWFNEGATNLVAEKLLGIDCNMSGATDGRDSYPFETQLARQVMEAVGEDAFFEAVFFEPDILANKWHELTGDKCSYPRIVYFLDEHQRAILEVRRTKVYERRIVLKTIGDAYKKAEIEVNKFAPLTKKTNE